MTEPADVIPLNLASAGTEFPRRPWHIRLAYLRFAPLPVLLVAFLAIGFHLAPGYRGQMNPDGVSYLTIARQYLTGHFGDAVNAYWSPLYSWLLVPLLAFHVEPTLATKVLAIVIGGVIQAIVWWLGANLRLPRDTRLLVGITLCPILYYFGMDVTTPDLLITGMLLLYAAQITMPSYGRRKYDGAVTGALAGLAYFAKAYALPVLAGHLLVISTIALLRRKRRKRRRIILQAAGALGVFAVIVGLWAGALTHHYGYFTLGSTGRFNFAWNERGFEPPMHKNVLLPPPTPSGTSGWDDATVLPYTPWNPLATPADRAFWEKNRTRNENDIIHTFQKFTWLLWPIVLLGVRVAGSSFDPKPRRPGAIFVTLLLIYPLGYYLLHVYERFLSLECIGLLLLGAFAVCRLTWPLRVWLRVPLRTACVVLVAWSFLSNDHFNAEKDPPRMALGRWSIANRWGEGSGHRELSAKLAGLLPERASFASNDDWDESLNQALLLNLRYFGQSTTMRPADAAKDVQFYWVWGRGSYSFLRGKPEISGGRVANLRIYDLRAPATTLNSHP